ncbi:hypothetical protein HaLaN_29351, partial [Haematococcus lacustris]
TGEIKKSQNASEGRAALAAGRQRLKWRCGSSTTRDDGWSRRGGDVAYAFASAASGADTLNIVYQEKA